MNRERTIQAINGWAMLAVNILIFLTAALLVYEFIRSAIAAAGTRAACRISISWSPLCWLLPWASFPAADTSPCSRTRGGCCSSSATIEARFARAAFTGPTP